MKIVCFDKVINLDKFESVQYRTSFFGNSYPIEVIRHEASQGLFGGEIVVIEEIARFPRERTARTLVKAITQSWLANEPVFDVTKWKIANCSRRNTSVDNKGKSLPEPREVPESVAAEFAKMRKEAEKQKISF